MAGDMEIGNGRLGSNWRLAIWGGAACLLLLPFIAMQFTGGVNWGPGDFIVIGAMLLLACSALEVGAWLSDNRFYRGGVLVAVGTAFLTVWTNLAVGMIGSEDNLFNLVFGGVLVIGLLGALVARFRPRGLARTLAVMAVAQVAISVVVLVAGWDTRGAIFSGLFTLPWLLSAGLFKMAADERG